MILLIIVLVILALGLLASVYGQYLEDFYKGYCYTCHGTGEVYERGRMLTREEETPDDKARRMTGGQYTYHIVVKECPKCEGAGTRDMGKM